MFIVNNGAPKSGSTWVQKIIKLGISPNFPRKKWRNQWNSRSVPKERLEAYFQSDEWRDAPTLIKMHFASSPDFAFLDNKDARVIVSYRNLPDSVNSFFYHQIRMDKTTPDQKEEWLRTSGIKFAKELQEYRRSWVQKDYVLLLKFEDMVLDAPAHIKKILHFLDQPCDDEICEMLAEKTQVKIKKGDPFPVKKHVRTAGRSVAREEIPKDVFATLTEMEKALEGL